MYCYTFRLWLWYNFIIMFDICLIYDTWAYMGSVLRKRLWGGFGIPSFAIPFFKCEVANNSALHCHMLGANCTNSRDCELSPSPSHIFETISIHLVRSRHTWGCLLCAQSRCLQQSALHCWVWRLTGGSYLDATAIYGHRPHCSWQKGGPAVAKSCSQATSPRASLVQAAEP